MREVAGRRLRAPPQTGAGKLGCRMAGSSGRLLDARRLPRQQVQNAMRPSPLA
jgi:hypothetical protein